MFSIDDPCAAEYVGGRWFSAPPSVLAALQEDAPQLSAAFRPSAALDVQGAPMGRYYFHVTRGQITFLDREGIELDGLEEATEEAARRAWEIKARERMTDFPVSNGTIVVDSEFRTVLELPFHTAVDKDGPLLSVNPATPD
jgi:hypothetical protein